MNNIRTGNLLGMRMQSRTEIMFAEIIPATIKAGIYRMMIATRKMTAIIAGSSKMTTGMSTPIS